MTNFDKWEGETRQFLKDTHGIPKAVPSPSTTKNQMISDVMKYVAEIDQIDKNKLLVDLAAILVL